MKTVACVYDSQFTTYVKKNKIVPYILEYCF